ncbi:MAG: hypothetical protein JJD92_10880 [Frankiaceae bacterium]|nr:hypothetical protein [Frankiaceae bacterium]
MRRPLIALSSVAALVLATGIAVAAPPVPVPPVVPTGGTAIQSPNVTLVGTIPIEGVGVSVRTQVVDGKRLAYVSGAAGLSIYNANDPAKPLLLGHLPMYNWENEDIAVSRDGRTAIMTEFTASAYLHVVDVSDPALPHIVGSIVGAGDHTVTCANYHCTYLFGSDGNTFDIRDRENPKKLPEDQSWGAQVGVKGGHAVHGDEAGIFISDSNPLTVFTLDPDPLHLKRLTTGEVTKKTAYQHNNIRTRASRYVPRAAGESLGGPLRDGELLLGEGETNFKYACSGSSGAFSTWSMAGFDRGAKMQQLDVLRPVNGDFTDGNPATEAMGCSGHWFTQQDAKDGSVLVAAAWYEHGTRFLKVDPRTGKIRQVGYFQPVRGSTSQAYWIKGTDYVWSIDYHSGIDILKFDQGAKTPTTQQLNTSWLVKVHVVDTWSDIMRIVCKQEGQATPAQLAQLGMAGHHA